MSLNGNFTTRFHTHPGLVLLVCTACYLQKLIFNSNSICCSNGFHSCFQLVHCFTSTKIRHFVTLFACMLRHTCTCNTVPKNTFLCVIYTPNEHTFNGFHFGSMKTSIFSPLTPHLHVYLLYACLSQTWLFLNINTIYAIPTLMRSYSCVDCCMDVCCHVFRIFPFICLSSTRTLFLLSSIVTTKI